MFSDGLYDDLGRVTARTAECGNTAGKLTSTYTYVDGAYGTNSTTPLVKKITQNGISFEYEYDSRGNIVSENRGNLTTTYAYDALGQLIRVNDPHENATWVYNYDRGGNITSKVKYAFTTGTPGTAQETIPYVYGDSNWKDKLTSYNGQTITYDAIGNPTNDGTWTYEWQAGRQLKRMSREGQAVSFKYGHDGLRIEKVLEHSWYPETTKYTYHGKLLTHMTVDYTDWDEVAQQDKLHFFYDAQSRPAKVNFNGTIYTYIHNLQGDVVGLLDNAGSLVVEYKYDGWGRLLSTIGTLAGTLGKRNPFRYRGYVYDEEAGLYYLRSRYYVAMQNRMLNADDVLVTHRMLGCTLYQYCRNNPTCTADPNGREGLNATSLTSFGSMVARFILSHVPAYAEKLKRLTKSECILSCNYPAAALVVDKASEKASAYTNRLFKSDTATLPTNVDGSIANGFKHAMWNALITKHFSVIVAEAFTTAHESNYIGDQREYLSSTLDAHANMDLYYNNVGRTVAVENPNVTDGELAMLVLSAVLNDPSRVLNSGTQPDYKIIMLLLASGEFENF